MVSHIKRSLTRCTDGRCDNFLCIVKALRVARVRHLLALAPVGLVVADDGRAAPPASA